MFPGYRVAQTSHRYFVSIKLHANHATIAHFRWQSTSSSKNESSDSKISNGKGQKVKLTSETYPEIKRDSKYSVVTPEHIQYFKKLLGEDVALIDGTTKNAENDLEPFNQDWMRKYKGQSKLVLKPGSTEEVSKILSYCNNKMLAVVPQGGNSGLVGGSVPVFDEIIISMSRMKNIRNFDEISGVLVVDAGCILEVVDEHLKVRNHIFPLDLGAKGSCHIGGNVSTNAGGLRLMRYGSLHGNVLGIEAVLPDGTIIDDLSKMRKNNTGYDLKQLFIGAEGTLGIITGVSMVCAQRSKAVNVAFFGLESYEKVIETFTQAKIQLSEILSAFELMDQQSQEVVHKVANYQRPLEHKHPFYCLIETSGSNSEHDNEKLGKFLEFVLEKEIVSDGVLAQDDSQIKALWGWREGIPETLGYWGGVYKYDLSIPIGDLYKIVEDVRDRIGHVGLLGDTDKHPVVTVTGYGHMGDSNLHLNIATRCFDKRVENVLEPFVYEWVGKRNGSISAEHGLGLAKKNYIGYSRNNTMIQLMKQVKNLFDPMKLARFINYQFLRQFRPLDISLWRYSLKKILLVPFLFLIAVDTIYTSAQRFEMFLPQ